MGFEGFFVVAVAAGSDGVAAGGLLLAAFSRAGGAAIGVAVTGTLRPVGATAVAALLLIGNNNST